MSLDTRAILASLPGDEEQVQGFLKRFDEEGPSQELYSDVTDFLQARIDANLDAMGAPKVDENDPQLAKAAEDVAAQTQAALTKFEASMAGFAQQANDLGRDVADKMDAADADSIRDGIAHLS